MEDREPAMKFTEQDDRSPASPPVIDEREDMGTEKRRDDFLAIVGHELRTPLAAVRTALDVLTRGSNDAAMREQALALMNRQTRLMSEMLDRLLECFRVRHGKVPLRKQAVDLRQLLETVIETVRPCIDGRRHQLELTLPPISIILEADATRLEEALSNLLENAAKYTDPGGRIELIVTLKSDAVVLQIRDNGIGIGGESLPYIFDLFRQSPHTTGHCQGGLGIGLALVRQIVEMHGGTVDAFSAGPGKGSEFLVCLPATHFATASEPDTQAVMP
jgi:signal transduction histidine kinase